MHAISPNEITGNVFDRIGKQWMLITVKDGDKVNTMTASWGGFGVMWNKNVAYCVVRPQRYTYEFLERVNSFTLSFFSEGYRSELNMLGMFSGRDLDKIKESGLTLSVDGEYATFTEARMVLRCRTLYSQSMTADSFVDTAICEETYPNSDFHRLFIAEILEVFST